MFPTLTAVSVRVVVSNYSYDKRVRPPLGGPDSFFCIYRDTTASLAL